MNKQCTQCKNSLDSSAFSWNENGVCNGCNEMNPQPPQECKCACHINKLNKPYEHDTKCCDNMNGFIPQPQGVNEEWSEDYGKIMDLFVSPTNRSQVRQCVLGGAEHKGTIRINSSAIPLFRMIASLIRSLLQSQHKELLKEGKEKEICHDCKKEIEAGTTFQRKSFHPSCLEFMFQRDARVREETKAELLKVVSEIDTKEHICRFNDGEHNCDCYLEAINKIKTKLQ